MAETNKTLLWWRLLCVAGLLNLSLWSLSSVWWPATTSERATHVGLSAVFVMVCAFRSAFPRVDLERYALWDTGLSSIFLGRSLATLAEMCFVAQCALVLLHQSDVYGEPTVATIAKVLVPLIAVAQVACWYAVLTLDHLWHAVEELLWSVMVALLALALGLLLGHASGLVAGLLVAGIVACAGSAVLMAGIDVPMYFKRRAERREQGLTYLTVPAGVHDTLATRRPTQDWAIWRHEVPWMTLYFTFGVWLSLAMAVLGQL